MRFRCDRCHRVFEEQVNCCTECGCEDFWALTDDDFPEKKQQAEPMQFEPQEAPKETVPKRRGNILTGLLGAFLFGLPGGVLYCLIYQFGLFASITGFVTYSLAYYGYLKFANPVVERIWDKIFSYIVMLVIIFIASLFMLFLEVHQICVEYEISATGLEKIFMTADLLKNDKDTFMFFILDLGMAYILGMAGIFIHKKKD